VIATKAGFVRPGPDQWKTNGRPEHLRTALEGSLRRLKVERVDLYQLHRIDPAVPLADQLGTFKRMQDEGKSDTSACRVPVADIERAQKIMPIVSVQNRYSPTDRQHEAVLDHCERERWPSCRGIRSVPGRRCAPRAPRQGRGPAARDARAGGDRVVAATLAVMLPIPGRRA